MSLASQVYKVVPSLKDLGLEESSMPLLVPTDRFLVLLKEDKVGRDLRAGACAGNTHETLLPKGANGN